MLCYGIYYMQEFQLNYSFDVYIHVHQLNLLAVLYYLP